MTQNNKIEFKKFKTVVRGLKREVIGIKRFNDVDYYILNKPVDGIIYFPLDYNNSLKKQSENGTK